MPTLTEPGTTTATSMSVYLTFHNAAAAIDFYKRAFGAEETMRISDVSGKIGHAEIRIAGSTIMLSDEYPAYGALSPKTLGGSPARIHLHVPDVDGLARQAVEAGAKIVRPIQDQFYGDRTGQLQDPFGYTWTVATVKEVLPTDEIQRRLHELERAEQGKQARRGTGIRKGFRTLTPYIIVQDAPALIEVTKQVFGAEQTFRAVGTAGGVHAEVRLGD